MRYLAAVMLAVGAVTVMGAGDSAVPGAAEVAAARGMSDALPVGKLGVKVGELVTVEGVREDGGAKSATASLRVDAVDGKALASPVWVWVDNVELPAGRCVLRGYETEKMQGMAPAYEELAKLKGEAAPRGPAAGWGVFYSFEALEALEPAGAKIKGE